MGLSAPLEMYFHRCVLFTRPYIFPVLKVADVKKSCAYCPRMGLTANVIAKSNAMLLAGSCGRFNASGLPRVRMSRNEPFEQLT